MQIALKASALLVIEEDKKRKEARELAIQQEQNAIVDAKVASIRLSETCDIGACLRGEILSGDLRGD